MRDKKKSTREQKQTDEGVADATKLGSVITFALALKGDGVRIGSDLFVVERKQNHDRKIFLVQEGRGSLYPTCMSEFEFDRARAVLVSIGVQL